MILGITSFPTPLSPVTKTEMSVGATLIAFCKAWFNWALVPIIPNLCFIDCNESKIHQFYWLTLVPSNVAEVQSSILT